MSIYIFNILNGGCFSLAYRTSVCLIPPLRTPSRESLNFPMWIERKLGMDIDPSAYPECWKESNGFFIYYFPIIVPKDYAFFFHELPHIL
ncbi:hypothetical protein DCAR_0521088 [Daucus carota subsp. sativus]|uniref:Uncharacterized protein n=1 Tax=Daucus carota subsp. sativus TaxID=79200 RepID=A0AAF1B228_DAUCS|nr:hypothetical protein DCAR_0521088 [Daucus carota subsp. sativus]